MFIQDQYMFGNALYWPYQQEMEMQYFCFGVYEADLLWTLLIGA